MPSTPRRLIALLVPCLVLGLTVPAAWGQGKPSLGLKKKEPPPKQPVQPKEGEKLTGFKIGPEELTRFEVDPSWKKQDVGFTSKAPKETIKGKASKVAGYLDINPRTMSSALGKFTVEWTDVSTANTQMDGALHSSRWMDAAQYPEITFVIRGLEGVKPNPNGKSVRLTLLGIWEMHGLEKEMKIPATLTYSEAPKGKADAKEGISIRTLFKIGLADFEIKDASIGSKVAPKIDVKVVLNLAKSDKRPGEEPEETARTDDTKKKPSGDEGGGG